MTGLGLTDRGLVRDTNQDSFSGKRLTKECFVAVVCDGMGGAAGGGVASSIAKDIYLSDLEKSLLTYIDSSFKDGAPVIVIPRLMRDAVRSCNCFTHQLSLRDKDLHGMGTTLVSAVVYRDKVYVCNVGDSRAYAFDDKEVHQITKDHSYVQELVDQGRLSESEARRNSKKNIITRAIGVSEEVDADTFVIENKPDLRYILLCSDGLSNHVAENEMHTILFQPEEMIGFERKVRTLIDLANKRGGEDNITVFVIKPEN